MTPAAAKRVVLLAMGGAAALAAVQALRGGRRPSLRLGAGLALGTVALTALADPAPAMAAGLAAATAFTSAALNLDAFNSAVAALDAQGKIVRRTKTAGAGGTFTETAPGGGGGGGGFGARGPDDLASSGTGTSTGGCVDASALVPIGQGSHRLTPQTTVAFKAAQALYGGTITITDSYRSCARQTADHAREPGRFAPANKSAHPRGEAIDVNLIVMGATNQKLFAALRSTGWCQSRPSDEPWHWSYNGCR